MSDVRALAPQHVRRWQRAAGLRPFAVAVGAVIGLALLAPSYSLATLILIYAIAAMACNLLLGQAGLMSFGQGIFFGLGAYTAGLAFVHWGVQAPAGALLGMAVAGAGAAVVGWLCILRRGVHFVMLTFAFASMFAAAVYVFKDLTGGENGLRGFPEITLGAFGSSWASLDTAFDLFCVTSVCFVAVYLALGRVERSPFGATLLAIRENEDRALAIGYDTKTFKLVAFTLSGIVTGLAGALYAVFLGSVPDSAIQVSASITILVIAILGGSGSLFGSFLGALVYLLLSDYVSDVWDRWQIILAAALLAIVLYMRGGIWGGISSLAIAARRDGGRS